MKARGIDSSLPNPDQVRNRWQSLGFSFGVFRDPPGRTWANFVHDTDELVMLIRGRMLLEMEGRSEECAPGKEVLIPAGTRHSVRNTGTTPNEWYYGYKTG